MKKMTKDIREIGLLGKSLDDLANEIAEGRADAAHGIEKMAKAYNEAIKRFPDKADRYFMNDPRTRWLSKRTRDMLRMVANKDLDPRVVLIPEPNLSGFIEELPVPAQKKLLDQNPFVTVIDGSGSPVDVSYIDITAKQTKIAYDQENQRFRTVQEQRNFVANERAAAKKTVAEWRPYRVIGNTVKFDQKCVIGKNELIEIVRGMGVKIAQ